MEIGLYFVCAAAGFVVIAGSLFLIWKGRIYIDAETKQVTKIELPMGIKLQTNLPVLALFIFGVFLLAFPIHQIRDLRGEPCPGPVRLNGNIVWGEPLDVDIVTLNRSTVRGEVSLVVPRLINQVTVTYWARGKTSWVDSEDIPLDGAQPITLRGPKATFSGEAAGGLSGASRKEPGVSATFDTSGPH